MSGPDPHIEQESERVPGRPLAEAGVLTLIVTIACVLVAWWLGECGAAQLRATHSADQGDAPEEIGGIESGLLDDATVGELRRAALRERLNRWGWVDRSRGRVHVPVDVAIDLYLGGAR